MKDFLILRYYISCPFVTDSVNTIYEKFYSREHTAKNRYRDDPRNRILTAEEARSLIEKHRMVKVCENKEGVVWTIG